ncbi:MAG: hypothetical protein WDM81_10780 [Rhizomicrobium sp.]
MHVLRHQQIEIARQLEHPSARLAGLELVLDSPLIVEIDEIVARFLIGRPAVEIADDRLLEPIGEQIEPRPAMGRAADDHVGQAAQAELLVLLGQPRDLRLDDLVGLGVQRALGVPIGERDQRRHRHREDGDVDKNDAVRLRP